MEKELEEEEEAQAVGGDEGDEDGEYDATEADDVEFGGRRRRKRSDSHRSRRMSSGVCSFPDEEIARTKRNSHVCCVYGWYMC